MWYIVAGFTLYFKNVILKDLIKKVKIMQGELNIIVNKVKIVKFKHS